MNNAVFIRLHMGDEPVAKSKLYGFLFTLLHQLQYSKIWCLLFWNSLLLILKFQISNNAQRRVSLVSQKIIIFFIKTTINLL